MTWGLATNFAMTSAARRPRNSSPSWLANLNIWLTSPGQMRLPAQTTHLFLKKTQLRLLKMRRSDGELWRHRGEFRKCDRSPQHGPKQDGKGQHHRAIWRRETRN